MLLSHVPSYFKTRRDRLMKNNPGAVFIFPSNPDYLRNHDVTYPYRQDSNFYYLSGFEEAESALVLAPSKSSPGSYKTVLFVQKRDPENEIWEGEKYGTERALSVFGADEAYLIEEFGRKLPELLQGCEKIFYRLHRIESWDRKVLDGIETYRKGLGRSGKSLPAIQDPHEIVGEMRMFKAPEEIALLRKACEITAAGHVQAMKESKPGMNEFEIEALIDYSFRKGGCGRMGYGSIVAGGKNATCLHYRANNEVLKDGDLLLIDAGGEFGFYTADITRTFPVGKKFSKDQATIYDLVLKSQLEALKLCKPGSKLPEIHRRACDVLIDGMLSLGLMKGKPDELFTTNAFKRFYPHGTGHWLGMDVHDAGLYLKNGEPRPLEEGMCFTVEPGFYVQPNDKEAPENYKGIGVRIEDDIIITATGCEILTAGVPKTRDEIEALKR